MIMIRTMFTSLLIALGLFALFSAAAALGGALAGL